MQFSSKRAVPKKMYSTPVLVLLLLVCAFLLRATWNIYVKEELAKANLTTVQNDISAMESRKDELAQSVQYLGTADGIDAELRNKYHVAKPGEHLAIILLPNEQNFATTTPQNISAWRSFLNMFGL